MHLCSAGPSNVLAPVVWCVQAGVRLTHVRLYVAGRNDSLIEVNIFDADGPSPPVYKNQQSKAQL